MPIIIYPNPVRPNVKPRTFSPPLPRDRWAVPILRFIYATWGDPDFDEFWAYFAATANEPLPESAETDAQGDFGDPFEGDVPVRASFDPRTKTSEPCPDCKNILTAHSEIELSSYYLRCHKCGHEEFVPMPEGMD